VLAVVLGGAIIASAYAKAPRRAFSGGDLRRLVFAALVLYATGIVISALAAWLSRGSDSGGGPPPGDDPADEQPPPDPDGVPQFDWAAFEREFRVYSERGEPTGTR